MRQKPPQMGTANSTEGLEGRLARAGPLCRLQEAEAKPFWGGEGVQNQEFRRKGMGRPTTLRSMGGLQTGGVVKGILRSSSDAPRPRFKQCPTPPPPPTHTHKRKQDMAFGEEDSDRFQIRDLQPS